MFIHVLKFYKNFIQPKNIVKKVKYQDEKK